MKAENHVSNLEKLVEQEGNRENKKMKKIF